jgi:hypothetical protein
MALKYLIFFPFSKTNDLLNDYLRDYIKNRIKSAYFWKIKFFHFIDKKNSFHKIQK